MDGLNYLIEKGNAMESWQEMLENLKDVNTNESELSFTESKDEFMKKVIQLNMNASEEIRDVQISEHERRDLKPTSGWGSAIQIQVDNETGEVDYVERRE